MPKARLTQLADELGQRPQKDMKPAGAPKQPRAKTKLEPNPERGTRGDFLKVTVTMPADMLGQLRLVGMQRRAQGAKDHDVSALVREAVANFLKEESS